MKIRIISLKNSSSYFAKILILVIIATILGKFYYSSKNGNLNSSIKLNSNTKFNSWKFSNIINKEIAVFKTTKQTSNNNINLDYNGLVNKSTYTKQLIEGELDIMKIANLQDSIYLNLNENIEDSADVLTEVANNNNNFTDNQDTVQTNTENITEPGIRTKYRGVSFKCAR